MNDLKHKLRNAAIRKRRVRTRVNGTSSQPRLSVFVSNRHITAQIIDDTVHKTLVYVSTVGQTKLEKSLTEKARWVGQEVAKKATAAKIKRITFDRGSKIYHGRVEALAQAAREAGLEF